MALATAGAVASPFLAQAMSSMWSSAMNVRMANKQMKFQERMASTAHQREVADLKAAGINPVLTARGQGSAAPMGAKGEIESPLGKSYQDYIQKKMVNAQVSKAEADAEMSKQSVLTQRAQQNATNALEVKTMLEAENLKEQEHLIRAQTNRENTNARLNSAQADNIAAQTPREKLKGRGFQAVTDFIDKPGEKVQGAFEAGKKKAHVLKNVLQRKFYKKRRKKKGGKKKVPRINLYRKY